MMRWPAPLEHSSWYPSIIVSSGTVIFGVAVFGVAGMLVMLRRILLVLLLFSPLASGSQSLNPLFLEVLGVGLVTTAIGIWLGYANIFIATFILIYAYLFLQQTNEHKDRRPWEFLFVASLLFLVFQIFNIMFLSGVTYIWSESIDVDLVRNLFAFLYSGCVLLAFVSQHDLILRSQLILISKKDPKPVEKDLEVKIGIGSKQEDDALLKQSAAVKRQKQ